MLWRLILNCSVIHNYKRRLVHTENTNPQVALNFHLQLVLLISLILGLKKGTCH